MKLGHKHSTAEKTNTLVRRIRNEERYAHADRNSRDNLVADLLRLKEDPFETVRYFNNVLRHQRDFRKAFGTEMLDKVFDLAEGDMMVPIMRGPVETPMQMSSMYLPGRIEVAKADDCKILLDAMVLRLMRR